MWKWLGIWWRGWSDEDLASARLKMAAPKEPGSLTLLTQREWRAFVDNEPTYFTPPYFEEGEKMTAPLHLLIAIHYHTSGSGEDYCQGTPHGESKGTADCIQDLLGAGLLTTDDPYCGNRKYGPTDGLAVWINELCQVPFPVQKWIIPKP